jgi:hypothetical protein
MYDEWSGNVQFLKYSFVGPQAADKIKIHKVRAGGRWHPAVQRYRSQIFPQ